MRFLITPDSFKESLSAYEAAVIMERGIKNIIPDAVCDIAPMADGGEGTAECLMYALHGREEKCFVEDPLGRTIQTDYVWVEERQQAVIEVAKACGIALVPQQQRNPLKTSSYGVGQMILHSLQKGCKELVLTLGGTVTNDGGCGMLMALGAVIKKKDGSPVSRGGQGLEEIDFLDMEKPRELMRNVKVTVLCDVNCPLLGKEGATYVFGSQKGVSDGMMPRLEHAMENYADWLGRASGRKIDELPGAGAAGGIGAALYAICEAQFVSGAQYVMQALELEDKVRCCDCVITGEGSFDSQSLQGKVPVGIARLANRYHKPVVVFAGMTKGDNKAFYSEGITAAFSIIRKLDTLETTLAEAEDNLQVSVENFAKVLIMRGTVQ